MGTVVPFALLLQHQRAEHISHGKRRKRRRSRSTLEQPSTIDVAAGMHR